MLFLGVFSILLVTTSAEFCYSSTQKACSTVSETGEKTNCTAQYGAIETLEAKLQTYINANINSSFEFLLMSSYFGNYEVQREGFKKLYRKYSDKLWEDAISIIKYVIQRGGKIGSEHLHHKNKNIKEKKVLELSEIQSLAKALDIQKELVNEAMKIHLAAQHHRHDGGIAHYIAERFLEPQAERVRELAGYTNDLMKLLSDRNSAVSVFLFDEYLKNSL